MKTEYKIIVLSILLGLFLWVADAALDYFIYYQGTFWGLLIYEIPPHEIYARTLVLGCCVIFGAAISTVFGKFRRAEEKRRESEKQLRLAVKNSRDVLYKLNLRTGDFDYVSPSVVELGGYTPQEFILLGVKGLLRRIDPEDRHRFMMHFRNVLRQAVEDGLAPTIEYRWKHNSGSYRWFSDNRAVVRDTDGNPVSLIGSVRDVTVQKEAEKTLGESEKKYRTLIETAQEGIGITSPGEEFVFVNRAFASILGYEPSELVGRNLRDFVTEERFEAFQMETGKREWGTSSRYEVEMRHRDGSHRSLLVSASPLYDREGSFSGTLGMVVDITERKRAEEALWESEEKYRLVSENIPVVVYSALPDEHSTNVLVTGRILGLTGYSHQEFMEHAQLWTQIIHPDDRDYVWRKIEEHREKMALLDVEYRIITKNNTVKWVRDRATPMLDENGQIVRIDGFMEDITERKRAEESLRESEEKLDAMLQSIGDHMSMMDEDLNILWANEVAKKLFGNDIIGKKCYEVYHQRQEPCEPYPCLTLQAFRDGKAHEHDTQVIDKDGRMMYFHCKANVALRDKDGKPTAVIEISSDITERKRAEEEVRGTKESYDRIIDNADEVIFRVGAEGGHVVYANPAAERLFGYLQAEWLADPTLGFKIIHPDFAEEQKKIIEEINTTRKRVKNAVLGWIAKDGRQVIVEYTIIPITDEEGKIVYFESIGRDITERRRAEEAIKRSEEQLRALFDSAADLVFTKDREGRYSRVNAACAKLHGLSEKEFIGKTDFDLFPEEYAQYSRELDRHVIKEGRTFTGEYERPMGGKLRTFSVVKTPLYGPDGAIIGLCGIARDITEQKSLEEQFRHAQKMEAMGTLAGGVAHDFNNLLGGILGYVGLIKGDYSPGEKHYAMLELVEKAGVRAAELTNQLLAFSRKGKFELRAVNLNNSVEDVLKLIGRTLDKNIENATELQEKLPSVEGDPGQLEQAIINLCVNAAEAMPGGGKLQLETRVVALEEEFARKYLGSDARDYVLLSVSDTGIGMDSETLSRMFEPFFTTKEVGKGTGLGLSTVYGIIKNHGGYVDVRSQPGKGSTFDIYLPVSKKEFTPPQTRAAELQTGHETILAVDDEEIIRSLLEETLHKLGYKVILARDGEEAIEIFDQKKDEIDAVIIDMIMPHVGGRETFREIKRRNPDVRVLLASGYSQDGAAQRILDEGVKGFIQKPFELVELSQKLRQVLD